MGRGETVPGLREARLLRALTQQELADAAGLRRNTVVRLEGGTKPADMRTIRKLAAALGVTPAALMGRE